MNGSGESSRMRWLVAVVVGLKSRGGEKVIYISSETTPRGNEAREDLII